MCTNAENNYLCWPYASAQYRFRPVQLLAVSAPTGTMTCLSTFVPHVIIVPAIAVIPMFVVSTDSVADVAISQRLAEPAHYPAEAPLPVARTSMRQRGARTSASGLGEKEERNKNVGVGTPVIPHPRLPRLLFTGPY